MSLYLLSNVCEKYDQRFIMSAVDMRFSLYVSFAVFIMFLSCIIRPLSSQLFDAHTVVALLYIKEIVFAPRVDLKLFLT